MEQKSSLQALPARLVAGPPPEEKQGKTKEPSPGEAEAGIAEPATESAHRVAVVK
jgi:hypothetical protein